MIPQAFTTRDMSDAYRWLQTLSPAMREEMKTMEQVVLSYLKAKRLGIPLPNIEENAPSQTNSENPKSAQDFQKTLKNLQTELKQFDFTPGEMARSNGLNKEFDGSGSSPSATLGPVDPKSRQLISEIREGFNLSSDSEVVRMCLVLARKVLKDLIP